ncbi:MAG: transglycosylase SLT domain-containing protein [Polyangiaceae bacterium]
MRIARQTRLACHLIVATIATESAGKADSVRLEPGYKSDEETPHRVSVGLTQTLISTARETMQMSFGRDWLLEPHNAILAGASYIAKQARMTGLDPPLVAAAYNAGKLYHQTGRENRWKLRQFPIGTGHHCDRFVRFLNDAVAVLRAHDLTPSVGLANIIDDGAPPRVAKPAKEDAVTIRFAENASEEDVTPYSRGVLESIARAAGISSCLVSSTSRDPYNQARVMYDNLEKYGVDHQKKLYGPAGDKVIDVYAAEKGRGGDRSTIIAAMRDRIRDIGPSNVSRHASDPRKLCVLDIAPSSIKNKESFREAVMQEKRVAKFLEPPGDPGYHLEIPQPRE